MMADEQKQTTQKLKFSGTLVALVLGFFLLLPVMVLGWAVVGQIIKFMKSPIIAGMIPAWVVLTVAILLFMLLYKKR